MKKNGFTLLELLVVIAILAVIALISVPTIVNVISESRENAYLEQERSIVNAAKTYMANNSAELPKQAETNGKNITVEELQKAGLLSSKNKTSNSSGIKNPLYNRTKGINITPKEERKYFDGCVNVKWNGSKYTYVYDGTDTCKEEK